ncbi:MAG: putative Ig domain-containing protein [Nitrospirota bacterium]
MIKKIFLLLFIASLILCCKGKDMPKEPLAPQPEPVTSEPQEISIPAETEPVEEEEVAVSEKTVPNRAPYVVSIDVAPLYPKTGDTIKVTVVTNDLDKDEVTLEYLWFKNDEPLFETSDALTLNKEDFKRGDKITLQVIPDDGKEKGGPGFMTATIGNSPPEIISSPSTDGKIADRKFTYQLRAMDQEEDTLTYTLKTAPSGMTIDSETGFIEWNIPPGFKEKAPVTIVVKDDQGGEAFQTFTFEIAAGT